MSASRYVPTALRATRDATGATVSKKIAISSTGANTALPLFAAGKQCRVFLITTDVPCLALLKASGSSTVSTTVFDYYIPASGGQILEITDGAHTHIDIITEPTSGTGSAYITPLQWNAP